jgi:hypothetical protein
MISYFEALYAKLRDDKRQSLVVYLLGRPELNQYNPQEARDAFIERTKINFLKCFSKEVL